MSPARPAFEGWDSALPSGSRVSGRAGAGGRHTAERRRVLSSRAAAGHRLVGRAGGQVFTLMDFKLKNQRGPWLLHGVAPAQDSSRTGQRSPEVPRRGHPAGRDLSFWQGGGQSRGHHHLWSGAGFPPVRHLLSSEAHPTLVFLILLQAESSEEQPGHAQHGRGPAALRGGELRAPTHLCRCLCPQRVQTHPGRVHHRPRRPHAAGDQGSSPRPSE